MCALKTLKIDKVGGYKNCLLEESARGLDYLIIDRSKVKSLSTDWVLFQSCASSLRRFVIAHCQNLKSVNRGVIERLTNLQSLEICWCNNLAFEEEDDDHDDGMAWKSLQSLSYLKLWDFPKLINLPKGIQYLTALQTLKIIDFYNLIALPEWLSCLTYLLSLSIWSFHKLKSLPEEMLHLNSLTRLEIQRCFGLTERCRGPNGEDWPKIQHIRSLTVKESW